MRLITWNCKGAFHRKHDFAAALNPDILVVPECEKLSELPQSLFQRPPQAFQWFGENPRKGLAVFAYGNYALKLHPSYDARFQWIVPVTVFGRTEFTLFAVWTVPVEESGSYVQPLIDAYKHYEPLMRSGPFVWAGDFNANFVFDTQSRPFKFFDFVALLDRHDAQSVYHFQHDCKHGEEEEKTFYLYHHLDKGHHIDYVFAHKALRPHGCNVSIGTHADWSSRSDHVPLICDFNERPA